MKKNKVPFLDGELPQVFVVTGDDYIGREKAKEKIIARLYTQFSDITEERYDSTIEPFEVYVERIITPSLFQSVRIFHIRHAQTLSANEIQRLSLLLSVDFPDVYVFIEFEVKRGRKSKSGGVAEKLAIKEKVKSNPEKFTYLKFDKPPDYKMAEWLTVQVPMLFNRKISKTGAENLIDLTGYELDKLYSELQKIDIHLPEKAPIDKEAVESITGASRAISPFELAEALGRKDMPRVLEIIDSLFQSTFNAPPCITAMFNHFWKILKIRAFALENKEMMNAFSRTRYAEKMRIAFEIGVAAGLLQSSDPEKKAYPVMILSGIIDLARKYTYDQLRKIFNWLRAFDVGVKTGMVKPTKQAFQLLCYRIVRVAELTDKDILQ